MTLTPLKLAPTLHRASDPGFDVVGVCRETASGAKDDRAQRQKVMALAQARDVEVVLVTGPTRWGRSTIDLFDTLGEFQAWGIP